MILILNTVRVPTSLVYLILISCTPSYSGGVSPPEHHMQSVGVGQLEHHIQGQRVGQLEHLVQCLGFGSLNVCHTVCCVSSPYLFPALLVIWKWQCLDNIMLCCVLQVEIPMTGNMLSCVTQESGHAGIMALASSL